MYLIVAIVTYRYAGVDVVSPALGSTSPLLQKIAYGVATPTIVIAGMCVFEPILSYCGRLFDLHGMFRGQKGTR